MKRFFAILALTVLASCSGLVSAPQPKQTETIVPVNKDGTINEKMIYLAEASYNLAASSYVEADTAGVLSPEIKTVLKPKMLQAYDLLVAAREAYELSDATAFDAKLQSLNELTTAIVGIVESAKHDKR